MAPKRNKVKAPAAIVEGDENISEKVKTRKRGGKVTVEESEELVTVAESVENGGGDADAAKPVSKRGRKGTKDVKTTTEENGNAVEQQEKEAPKPGKPKRGKKEKAPEADTKMDDEANDLNSEEIVEKVAPKSSTGRKRGKQTDSVDSVDRLVPEPVEPKSSKTKKSAVKESENSDNPKPKKEASKRGKKVPESSSNDVEKKSSTSRKREAKTTDDPIEAKKTKLGKTLLNKTSTNYEDIDFECKRESLLGKPPNFKISSWNVDGIRSWVSKGGNEFINREKPDVLCLQETKCPLDKLPENVATIPGYHLYWLNSDKDGYAGVGIYTKQMAINVQYGIGDDDLDSESRIITAEYERFYVICTYVPNSGRGLVTLPKRLKWNDLFRNFIKQLDVKKPVIICGDMNVSHLEIDLANPKTNKKNAGFTKEERDGMTALLGEGFVDTFRHLYPDKTGAYTFWTYMSNCRAKNVGWRLDYFIISERLLPMVCDNVIRNEVFGSDHCPLTLFLHLNGIDKLEE